MEERAEGRFRLHRLRAKPLWEVNMWLSRYCVHIERQLDALGHVLDAMPDEPNSRLGARNAAPAQLPFFFWSILSLNVFSASS